MSVQYGPYTGTVDRVHDGDTVHVKLDVGFDLTVYARVRLYGIDAPELAAPEGKAARDYAASLLPPGTAVEVVSYGWDKYGGTAAASTARSSGGTGRTSRKRSSRPGTRNHGRAAAQNRESKGRTMNKKTIIDLAERTGATFAQAFLAAVLASQATDLSALKIAGLAGAFAVAKYVLVRVNVFLDN